MASRLIMGRENGKNASLIPTLRIYINSIIVSQSLFRNQPRNKLVRDCLNYVYNGRFVIIYLFKGLVMSILVGRKAPDFITAAVLENGEIDGQFHLSEIIKDKYGILFFYPLDFTFVCPSELIALDRRMDEFKKRGVEVIAVSIDSQFTHNAWRNTPVEKGGIGPVKYIMAADINHNICQSYGVE